MKIIKLLNYALLLAILMSICLDGHAQVVIRPNIKPGTTPGTNPAILKEAARQAAVKKILDATVTKIDLRISKIPSFTSTFSKYKTPSIDLKENNKGNFVLKQKLDNSAKREYPYKNKSEPFTEIYSLKPDTSSTYRDLLNNGFMAKLDFTDRRDDFKYKCDVHLIFYFSDGTQVTIFFQEIGVSKEGFFKTNGNDLHISKDISGNQFPDPDNPLVLPPVK